MQGKILGIPLTVIVLWLAIVTPVIAVQLVTLREVRSQKVLEQPEEPRQLATPAYQPTPVATASAAPTEKIRKWVPPVVQSVTP